jgi:hypothetical protein
MTLGVSNSMKQTEMEVLWQGLDVVRETLYLLQSDPTHAEQLKLVFGSNTNSSRHRYRCYKIMSAFCRNQWPEFIS